MGTNGTVAAALPARSDYRHPETHAPAPYAPYTWELSTPHRCLVCDEETSNVPVRVWAARYKREWFCSKHMHLVPVVAALSQESKMADVLVEFRAQHLRQQKRCSVCQTRKGLKFFKSSGHPVLKVSDRLVLSESKSWIALCERHKHLKTRYCEK